MRTLAALGLLLVATVSAAGQARDAWPVAEFRQYTLRPGQRDVLITLFEDEFVESQEAEGMRIVGTFRDVDKPDRFVWIRAFKDMPSRAAGLTAFYTGPVWKAHGKAAASTMIDASNVLLLHDARSGSGFTQDAAARPAKGATEVPTAVIVANIYYFDAMVDSSFVDFFERAVRPHLKTAGIPVVASFVTETAANNYPRLPVRENDRVFLWLSRFQSQSEYDGRMAALDGSREWSRVADQLKSKLKSPPEVIRLQPTPRSQLR